MPRFNETSVVIHDCTIVWDSLTTPEQNKDGSPKWVLKLVFPPNSPDLAEFNQIAQEKLQSSLFNGVLPQGGRMPVGTAGPAEFGGLFPGFAVISAKTKFMPAVHSEDNAILDPMQWNPLIYTGQRVNVLVDCYHYDSHGNRGIGTGLQGVQILTSAGAQRLVLAGGGGPDTVAAFGGPQAAVAQPGPYAPPGAPVGAPQGVQPYQPQPGVGQPGQPVATGPAYGGTPGMQPAGPPAQQGYVQPGPIANPAYPAQAVGQTPAHLQQGQPGATQDPSAYPQQAQNFLPPGPGQVPQQ